MGTQDNYLYHDDDGNLCYDVDDKGKPIELDKEE